MSHKCIKTGCYVWLEDYREWVHGDAYMVGNALVIRVCSLYSKRDEIPRKHFTVHSTEYWPDKNKQKNQAFGSEHSDPIDYTLLITSKFTNHGYEGIKI